MKTIKVMYTELRDSMKGYYYIMPFSLYALETVAWHHKILWFDTYDSLEVWRV